LIVPMCLLSAIAGVWLSGGDNNIFTQIGFSVLAGLACKNAILIVEFARESERCGQGAVVAAIEAARLRLRPILMTSLAFIMGTVPLVLSAGAGAEARQAMGVVVFSGMLGVTFFGLFLTPVFYVALRQIKKLVASGVQSSRRQSPAAIALVTTVFAMLLICEPYGVSPENAALPTNASVRPVSALRPLAQTETVASAAQRPQTIRPEDIGTKALADRDTAQGPAGSLPGKAAAALAWRPSPAVELVDPPVVQPAQPVPARYEGLPHLDPVLSNKEVATVAPKPPASNAPQEQPVVQAVGRTPATQPVPGRREDPTVSRVDVEILIDGACTSGEVVALDPNGDNFLSVRSGPGGQPYREIDRLFTADKVHVCSRKPPWFAVVYSEARKPQESCDIGSKGTRRRYMGPCQYGWVHSRYLKVNATHNSGGL
jgi:hypothetical protein